jgi:hypothetical protein
MAQGEGPEFKPQYCRKKERKKKLCSILEMDHLGLALLLQVYLSHLNVCLIL